MGKASPVWEQHKDEIICDLSSGYSDYLIGKKFGVSTNTIRSWRSRVDFEIIPPKPSEKRLTREYVEMLPTKRFLEEQSVIIETTERFKEKGIKFLNHAIDRMEELLSTTKDIKAIAAGLNVLLPYLLARVDGGDDAGGSFEARRSAFIQNVQNNYNIKIKGNETDKEISDCRYSEESAAGNE